MNVFNYGCGEGNYFGVVDDRNNQIVKGRGFSIRKITQNLENDTFKLKLATNFGGIQTLEMERGDIIKKNIKTLRNAGFDITDKNFGCFDEVLQMEETLYLEQHEGYDFDHTYVGWQLFTVNDETEYLYKAYNRFGDYYSKYVGNMDIKPRGSLKAQIKMYKTEVLGNIPLEAILFISAAASVNGYIGRAVQTATPIFHICGDSSQGKTTAAKLAVSLYGNTEVSSLNLCRSWLSTPNMVTAGMKGNNGMVVSFDELSMFKKGSDISSLVYALSSGVDKARLTKEGEPKVTSPHERWQTVIISTGEASLLSKCSNNTGLKVRVFEITDRMTKSAKNADNILRVVSNNYGHIAPLLAKTMMNAGRESVINMFYACRHLLLNRCENNSFTERVCGAYALALTGGILLSDTIGVNFHFEEVCNYFVKLINSSAEERDMAEVAYAQILEEVSKNNDKFIYMSGNAWSGAMGKIVDFDNDAKISRQIIFYYTEFEKMMKRLGYESCQVVLQKLRDKGYNHVEKGKLYNRRKIGKNDPKEVNAVVINVYPPDKANWTKAEKAEYKRQKIAMHYMGLTAKSEDNVSPLDENYTELTLAQLYTNEEDDDIELAKNLPFIPRALDEFDMANCDNRLSYPKQPYNKNMATRMKYNRDNKDILLKQGTPSVTPR